MFRPRCNGLWVSGSGGHRKHDPCPKDADYWHPDDMYAYCDDHLNPLDRHLKLYLAWAEMVDCDNDCPGEEYPIDAELCDSCNRVLCVDCAQENPKCEDCR